MDDVTSIPQTTSASSTPVQVNNFPVEFSLLNSFVRWEYFRKPNGKLDKSPVNARRRMSPYYDATIHLSFAAAGEAAGGGSCGIGISLGVDGLALELNGNTGYLWCLDFDGFAEVASSRVDTGSDGTLKMINSYCEMSPSQTGFKVFFVTDRSPERKFSIGFGPSEFAELYPEVPKYRHRQIEVFSQGSFLALTGELYSSEYGTLRYIPSDEFDAVLDSLRDWSESTGGEGMKNRGNTGCGGPAVSCLPAAYNRLKPNSLKIVMKHIDNFDEGTWSDVANALARVYGEDGYEYFESYSRGDYSGTLYSGFDPATVEKRYSRALRELSKTPDGYGIKHLIELASKHRDWPSPPLKYEDAMITAAITRGDVMPIDPNHQLFADNNISTCAGTVGHLSQDPSKTLNDAGNADRFARVADHHLRYVVGLDCWIFWRNGHWYFDDTGQVAEFATQVARQIYLEAAGAADSTTSAALGKWASTSQQRTRLDSMVKLAQPKLAVRVSELDSNHLLLGVKNGVVNLRTGKFRQATPEDLITKIAAVEYDEAATCPIWDTLVDRWMEGNKGRVELLRRAVGYSLTGETKEQVFFFLYGRGANGKSTLLNAIREINGSYAIQSSPEIIMDHKYLNPSAPTPELARLAGRRFVSMVETEDGQRLAESRVKQMTGQDAITARMLHSAPFEFVPNFKLWLSGNHKPVIRGDDHGIWRRIVLIPFTATIPEAERDKDLPEKLRAEYPGILNRSSRE